MSSKTVQGLIEQRQSDGSGRFSLLHCLHSDAFACTENTSGQSFTYSLRGKSHHFHGKIKSCWSSCPHAGSSHVCKCVNWLDKWPGLQLTWKERTVKLKEQLICFTSVVGLDQLWAFVRAAACENLGQWWCSEQGSKEMLSKPCTYLEAPQSNGFVLLCLCGSFEVVLIN